MKIKVLCFLVGWVLGVGGLGAQGVVDSLIRVLNTTKMDTVKGKVLDDLAWAYLYEDPATARIYADSSYKMYQKAEYSPGVSNALNTIANTYVIEGELDKALERYNQALILALQTGAAGKIGAIYNNIGVVYFNRGALDTAVVLYQKGLEYREMAKDTSSIIASLSNIGGALSKVGTPEKAAKFLLRGAGLANQVKDWENLALCHSNLNAVYIDLHEWKQALYYARLAQPHFEASNNSYRLVALYNNIGVVFTNLGRPDSAVFYLNRGLEINNFDPYARAYTLHGLGDTKVLLNEDSAALAYYMQAMQLEAQLGMSRELINSNLSVGYIWGKMGQYDKAQPYLRNAINATDSLEGLWEDRSKALKYLMLSQVKLTGNRDMEDLINQYSASTDSLYSRRKFEAVTEIETKYQTEKKELQNQALQLENELQAKANRNQRLGLGGLSLGLAALAGLSLFLYRQRQRIQAQKAEIELLNREQRHRMMNNLVFANSLMGLQVKRLEEQPEARQAVKEAEARLRAMSALHRRLHHEGEGQKSIDLHGYLKEITAALQGSFSTTGQPLAIELHGPEGTRVDGEAAMRIGLIVNELATNSCKHAFAEQPQPQIDVHLMPEGEGRYRLVYTDNGSGLPADFEIDTQKSMGLYLIHNLVKQLNGRIAFSGESGTRVECELNLETV